METFIELLEYSHTKPVINTHAHHQKDAFFGKFNLSRLLRSSYVHWIGGSFEDDHESLSQYVQRMRFNSYFVWLERSLQRLYHVHHRLDADNWNTFSLAIAEAHSESGFHLKVLRNLCHYSHIIQDSYWKPGSDNGHPDLFSPTFRVNMFMFGFNHTAVDHNGHNAQVVYNQSIADIDDYTAFMRGTIQAAKDSGCVALKSALAYDRGLDFCEVSKDKAQKAFGTGGHEPTPSDIKAFQDYVFFQQCRVAAELGLPFQIHTGLGQLRKTNPMQLQEVIAKNPDTRFVLFHCGYPWLDETLGLLHLYPNVYPDLCWLPLISTSAAERMLHEMLEVTTVERICWGCDTWTAEESYGALLAMQHVLASVLSQKIASGYLKIRDAKSIIDSILYRNARQLYHLP